MKVLSLCAHTVFARRANAARQTRRVQRAKDPSLLVRALEPSVAKDGSRLPVIGGSPARAGLGTWGSRYSSSSALTNSANGSHHCSDVLAVDRSPLGVAAAPSFDANNVLLAVPEASSPSIPPAATMSLSPTSISHRRPRGDECTQLHRRHRLASGRRDGPRHRPLVARPVICRKDGA